MRLFVRRAGRFAKALLCLLVLHAGATFVGRKQISAMVRVRNEEEFLDPSVRSIIDIVDEIVIIDNGSDDQTPHIIKALAKEFPGKIRSLVYPYDVARQGQENEQLAASPGGLKSPRLLANFYNWCLSQCRFKFILKWDADTIATPELARSLAAFRKNKMLAQWQIGANVHADGQTLIGGRPYEDSEPRLFFRRFAHYDNGMGWCEKLQSPYAYHQGDRFVERPRKPLYVHMKFWKSKKFTNMSADYQKWEHENNVPGAPAPQEVLDTLVAWNLAPTSVAKVQQG